MDSLLRDLINKIKKNNKIDFNMLVKFIGYYYIIKNIYNSCLNYKYFIKKIPFVQSKINSEKSKIINKIITDLDDQTKTLVKFNKLNDKGIETNIIDHYFKEMTSISECDYKQGRMSGAYYSNNINLNKDFAFE